MTSILDKLSNDLQDIAQSSVSIHRNIYSSDQYYPMYVVIHVFIIYVHNRIFTSI